MSAVLPRLLTAGTVLRWIHQASKADATAIAAALLCSAIALAYRCASISLLKSISLFLPKACCWNPGDCFNAACVFVERRTAVGGVDVDAASCSKKL